VFGALRFCADLFHPLCGEVALVLPARIAVTPKAAFEIERARVLQPSINDFAAIIAPR
jgi:hypothetical protein